MKFTAVVLSSFAASAAAISSESASKLLSSARQLNNDANNEANMLWANNYSIKYQGCHHIKQWNTQADGQDDVRMYTKRLVRFRLCPSKSCSASEASGCSTAYGDYIVDMDTFLQSYWEAKEEDKEYRCEYFLNGCGCDAKEDDSVDEEHCQWNCAVNAGMEECIEDGNPDDESEQAEEVNYQDFFECKQLQVNNNGGDNNNGEQAAYYVGPYCSEQGGAIKIGIFTDDQCTMFAETSYYTLTGTELKYTTKSIVEEECTFCKENPDVNNNGQNDDQENQEEQAPREFCQTLYQTSGKCETYLTPALGDTEINEQACNYLSGIKMVRTDGMLDLSDARPSAVATAFIVIFAMAFAAMAFYVWYLRTRLGVKKTSLL
ncbi:hypothetical protein ACA910_018212 [Epithemia clementina (nom. ined.)]